MAAQEVYEERSIAIRNHIRRSLALCGVLGIAIVLLLCPGDAQAVEYPGVAPGPASALSRGDDLTVGNQALQASWTLTETGLQAGTFKAVQRDQVLSLASEVFQVVLGDGTVYRASTMHKAGPVTVSTRAAQSKSSRAADQTVGKQIEVPLVSSDGRLHVIWRAILLDGANYVRQEIDLSVSAESLKIRDIVWLRESVSHATGAGSVDGSVVVAELFFLACEDPMAANVIERDTDSSLEVPAGATVNSVGKVIGVGGGATAVCRLHRDASLNRGEVLTQSFVVGVAPQGQLRRAFLCYLERERAHPYRTHLHYNSWYDIAWKPFALNEENCLEAIRLFGERFMRPHDVVVDSMVFDDGWDNPQTLWQFHDGFPHGFEPLAAACRDNGTQLGVWLSPFGGYGEPRRQRLEFGRAQEYEINEAGFSLAGPKYYEAFKRACVEMIQQYGVNHFKFDGIAKGMQAQGGGQYVRDTEAMRRLMLELRQEKPDLFINLTTGSWPSPFWLRYADTLWRQGHDMGFAGPGPKQQQWLTYRDQEVYHNIVRRGPLYPLNALMTQGVAYSRQGSAGDPSFDSAGFKDDVRAFFGSGTSLQELYIQPGKLTEDDWTVLAEAAKWSRAQADVLVDTHWIGGDPGKLEVYGYASWSPRKGVVMLRNPNLEPQSFQLDVQVAFELPPGAVTAFVLKSPWQEDASTQAIAVDAGKPLAMSLQPFETVVFEATPVAR